MDPQRMLSLVDESDETTHLMDRVFLLAELCAFTSIWNQNLKKFSKYISVRTVSFVCW